MSMKVTNPYTGEVVGYVPQGTASDISDAVGRAHEGARTMRVMPLHRRCQLLSDAGQKILKERESFARLIVAEAGKTIRESRAEVDRTSGIFQLAAEEARRLHGETVPFDAMQNGEGRSGYWMREPVGVVGAITPWNVPLALSAHKIAPALAAGNAVVHKPAEQTPFSALKLAEILKDVGLPVGAVQVVTGTGEEAGDALVKNPDVGFVSFTGSRSVGVALPARAGFKRVALELGGNSPIIVTPTADLHEAASAIVRGGFAVAGQLCISVQRVLVHESVKQHLADLLKPAIGALQLGDPAEEKTDVGPLIDIEACVRVEHAVRDAVEEGGTVLVGGQREGRAGFQPTLFDAVRPDSQLAMEEVFAPVVILISYRTLDEAIAIANATPYGLNAGIYTNDLREAFIAAREIIAGSIMINDVPTFRSDNMPYGGRKQSGLGREGVRYAMEEMTDVKLICFRA